MFVHFQQFERYNEIHKYVGLMDINNDCQLMILEMLQMPDLMSLSDINKGLELLVQNILRRKFAKKTVVIRNTLYSPIMTIKYIEEFHDRIEVQHVLVVRKILEKFGHLILHLDIFHEYTLWQDTSKDIFRSINFYCADTLIELHISNWNDILMQFKTPFNKVEYLSLEGNFYKMSHSNLTFTEMFPRVQHLALRHLEYANGDFLELHYPHLTHLTAVVWNGNQLRLPWQINDQALRKLFENNLQIKSLRLKFPSTSLLHMIAEKLLLLERLEIVYFQGGMVEPDAKIRFVNLKKLIVNRGLAFSNLILGNIEEFETNGRDWVDMVKNEKNLKKLRINRLMEDEEVLELANANTNLTEIYLQCGKDIQEENLVKLIESNRFLRNLCIKTHPVDVALNESVIEGLQGKLADRWIITQIPLHVDFTCVDLD